MIHSITIEEIMSNGIAYIVNPDSKIILIKTGKIVLTTTLDSKDILKDYYFDTVQEITLTRIAKDLFEITIHV